MAGVLAWLVGKKTYILAVIGMLTLTLNFLTTGDFSTEAVLAFLKELTGPAGLATLRAGISKFKS